MTTIWCTIELSETLVVWIIYKHFVNKQVAWLKYRIINNLNNLDYAVDMTQNVYKIVCLALPKSINWFVFVVCTAKIVRKTFNYETQTVEIFYLSFLAFVVHSTMSKSVFCWVRKVHFLHLIERKTTHISYYRIVV